MKNLSHCIIIVRSPANVMLLLRFVLDQLRSLLMLRVLRYMLIQMSMRTAWTSFAIAIANGDNILAIRSM